MLISLLIIRHVYSAPLLNLAMSLLLRVLRIYVVIICHSRICRLIVFSWLVMLRVLALCLTSLFLLVLVCEVFFMGYLPWIREHKEVHEDMLYSNIVRTDQFRPDKIAKREFDIGNIPSVSGLFDGVANGPKAVRIDDVTDIEIALREDRLSAPEVDKARRHYKNKAISENAQAKLEEASMVSRAQSDKVGKVLDSLLANNSNGD